MKMNNKGVMEPVTAVFAGIFIATAVICVAHIPARSALKTKLTNKCVEVNNGKKDRSECWSEVSSMTQKEREALNAGI